MSKAEFERLRDKIIRTADSFNANQWSEYCSVLVRKVVNNMNINRKRQDRHAVKTVTLVLTDKCNFKCKTCDIWEKLPDKRRELSKEAVLSILRSPDMQRIRHVNITGGEPFLCEDLFDIFQLLRVYCKKSDLTISTNGSLQKQMCRFFDAVSTKEQKRITLEISYLGQKEYPSSQIEIPTRESIHTTIMILRKDYPFVSLKIKYTVTPNNMNELEGFAAWCAQHRIKLYIKLVENSFSYTNSVNYKKNQANVCFSFSTPQKTELTGLLKNLRKNPWVEKKLLSAAIQFSTKGDWKKRCAVPHRSLFVNADGEVYGCRMRLPFGNIHDEPFEVVMENQQMNKTQLYGDDDDCAVCFSVLRSLL